MEVAITVSGNVADFDTTAQQAVINAFAADLGVDASRIVITSVTAGSVVIQFRITNPDVPAPPPFTVPTKSDDGVEAWVIAVPVVIGVLLIVGVVLVVMYCCPCCCCIASPDEEGKGGTEEQEGKVENEPYPDDTNEA